MIKISGRCACGAVRYSGIADEDGGYWCHCRMCQRAVGSVAAAFVTVRKVDIEWSGAAPVEWQSSPIARRGRCGICGTPLTFHYPDSDNMDLTIGGLDEPAAIHLTSHFGIESRVSGWIAEEGLPATRCEDHAPLQDRWAGIKGGPE